MKRVHLGWVVAIGLLAGCALETSADEPSAAEEVASVSSELKRNALTRQQEATALKLIDDICGDTWCEGDHNFRFDRLECRTGCASKPGTCELTFRLFSYDTDIETGPTYTRTCKTHDFKGFASLVDTQGSYQTLNWDYYEALTACIARVESGL